MLSRLHSTGVYLIVLLLTGMPYFELRSFLRAMLDTVYCKYGDSFLVWNVLLQYSCAKAV